MQSLGDLTEQAHFFKQEHETHFCPKFKNNASLSMKKIIKKC